MTVKLYKRTEESTLYWEAWEHGREVIIHWGVLGERGETRQIAIGPDTTGRSLITRESKAYRSQGFQEIDDEDHTLLLVQFPIEGEKDLDKADLAEDLLNECLGWTGNGYCDGNDIGSGTINVYCYVVEPGLAGKTIIESLRENGLLENVIVANKSEEAGGFTVLWPTGYCGTIKP
jgi:hypothetical protein